MNDDGTWLALGVMAALGVAGAVAQSQRRKPQRGSQSWYGRDVLKFGASGSGEYVCKVDYADQFDDLEVDWEEGDPPPTEDELKRIALARLQGFPTEILEPGCKGRGVLVIDEDSIDVEPHYEMSRTLGGWKVR